jgi:ABC-2 type transport system ATP-binding protein
VFGFLGPNGSGKTTTIRCLLGLVRPSGGDCRLLGAEPDELSTVIGRTGAIVEAPAFFPTFTGRRNLDLLARIAGVGTSRVTEVLEIVGLAGRADQRVKAYSLGMKQRLGIGAALLKDPEVLILDEPANGLDPAGVRWLRDFLRELAAHGRTILVSSHILAEIEVIADEVVIIHHGKFVASGTIAELVARASGGVRVRSPAAARLRELLAGQGATVVDHEGALMVAGATAEAIGELAAANSIVLHELAPERATLEQAFFELTEEPSE